MPLQAGQRRAADWNAYRNPHHGPTTLVRWGCTLQRRRTHKPMHTHTHECTYTHAHAHMHTHAQMHALTHTCTHTPTHMCTHAHGRWGRCRRSWCRCAWACLAPRWSCSRSGSSSQGSRCAAHGLFNIPIGLERAAGLGCDGRADLLPCFSLLFACLQTPCQIPYCTPLLHP